MRKALLTAVLLAVPAGLAAQEQDAITPQMDPAKVVTGTDTFNIIAQGNTIGTQVMTLEKVEDGFLFTDETVTPQARQTTKVRFGPDLVMRHVEQTGQAAGQEMRIDVAYEDGHATGTARVPTPQGVQERTIDAQAPPNAIDDNLFLSVLSTLPWSGEANWQVPLFLSGLGQVLEIGLDVEGTESVTVPAGTFDAYRVAMTGVPQPMALYVTTDAPHRLIKMTMGGGVVAFELQ